MPLGTPFTDQFIGGIFLGEGNVVPWHSKPVLIFKELSTFQ